MRTYDYMIRNIGSLSNSKTLTLFHANECPGVSVGEPAASSANLHNSSGHAHHSKSDDWEDTLVHYLGVDFLSHIDEDFSVRCLEKDSFSRALWIGMCDAPTMPKFAAGIYLFKRCSITSKSATFFNLRTILMMFESCSNHVMKVHAINLLTGFSYFVLDNVSPL